MQAVLQRYKELQDIIAILGMDELSEEDKLVRGPRPQDPALPRQPFLVAEVHRLPRQVREDRRTPSSGFQEIVDGKHDDLPEQAFYMVGTIEEALEKSKTLVR